MQIRTLGNRMNLHSGTFRRNDCLMAIPTLNGVKAMLSMNTSPGTVLTIDGFDPLSRVKTELKYVFNMASLLNYLQTM